MSKNLQLHIGLLLVFMALCFEESYASSDIYLNKENEGVKVCWVIEEWRMDYGYDCIKYPSSADKYKKQLLSQSILTLSTKDGSLYKEEIPTSWIPLISRDVNEGLYFLEEIDDGHAFHVLCWNEKGVTIRDTIVLWEDDEVPWMYDYGKVYTRTKNRKDIYAYNDGMRECVGDAYENGLLSEYEAFQITVEDYTDNADLVFIHGGIRDYLHSNTQYSYIDYGSIGPKPICSIDENHLLFFRLLECDDLPSAVLYKHQTDSDFGVDLSSEIMKYEFPLYQNMQLLNLSITEKSFYPYIDDEGKNIMITNLLPISNGFYCEYNNTIYFLCNDYNIFAYRAGYEFDWFALEGRTLILSIDLHNGEQNVLYETGYEKPDYIEIWDYLQDRYSIENAEKSNINEWYLEKSQITQSGPIKKLDNNAMEFIPNNFSVYIITPDS